jgi:GNAT superfamily N-acetyltransferase
VTADRGAVDIRECQSSDFGDVCAIINDAAAVYRGVIADDRWKDPYMSAEELRREIDDGVAFWCAVRDGVPVAVMGLQPVADVALIRHAYTRLSARGSGIGGALLAHLRSMTDRPMLVGTWQAATWAIAFYERRGFRLVGPSQKDELLRRYWTVPDRQIAESVVLADRRWFETCGSVV